MPTMAAVGQRLKLCHAMEPVIVDAIHKETAPVFAEELIEIVFR